MKIAKLADLCDIGSGGTPRRGRSEYYGGAIPWAKIGDLNTSDGIVTSTEETLTEVGLSAIRKRLFPPGTILLAMYGSVGKTAVAGVPLSANQAILGIQVKDAALLRSDYLKRWLDHIRPRLASQARGVTQQNISATIVRDLRVPLPAPAEQERIAAMLDRADGIRRKRQESLRLLDELLRSAFLEMFGDPVRNEKKWREVAIADVATVQLGKMLSDKARGGSDPVPYLRNANVQWRRFDLRSLLRMDYTSDELAKFDLRPGDLLVCEGGEVGRCAIWEGQLARCSFQKALHRVRPIDDRLRVEYLQECLFALAQRGALSQSTSQATIAHLTKERLEGLTVPLPDARAQQVFARFYQGWAETRKRVDARFVAVDQLCEALAARAFLMPSKS